MGVGVEVNVGVKVRVGLGVKVGVLVTAGVGVRVGLRVGVLVNTTQELVVGREKCWCINHPAPLYGSGPLVHQMVAAVEPSQGFVA